MPKKIQDCTMAHLISVPLPAHGATYTTISHQFVIDYSKQQLIAEGFVIVDEEYRCTADGQIAQGIYKLNFNSDPELSMMFAWTNSYNKQVKFKCLVGAYINRTGSVMTSGELGTWTRKHTGSADTETKDMIDSQVQNANMYYNQLVSDKASMEGISLNKRRQAQMLGILFAEFQILTTEQGSMVRSQMDRPSHVFTDSNSLWAFYNYVTIALQHSHPRTWMEDQRILHYFISTVGNFTPVAVVAPVVEDTPVVDPLANNYGQPENQTNLLVQIAEMEVADNELVQNGGENDTVLYQSEEIILEVEEAEEPPFDLDAEDDAMLDALLTPIEREISPENSTSIFPQDETVIYTDPVGNTFEAPIVSPDIDFSLAHDDESIDQMVADYEMMEAIESSEGTPAVANLDTIPVEKKEAIIDNSFDLDFVSDDTEESGDDIPDFF